MSFFYKKKPNKDTVVERETEKRPLIYICNMIIMRANTTATKKTADHTQTKSVLLA